MFGLSRRTLGVARALGICFSLLVISACFTSDEAFPEYRCVVGVWTCNVLPNAGFVVSAIKVTGPAKYEVKAGFWEDKTVAYKPYWDRNVAFANYGLDALKGMLWIPTRKADRNNASSTFLTLELPQEVDALYIAYDSRANPKPDWLTNAYTKQPGSLPITLNGTVALDIWKLNTLDTSQPLVIPGNSFGNPNWKNVKQGSPAMYVVFIVAEPDMNCDYPGSTKIRDHIYEKCNNIYLPMAEIDDLATLSCKESISQTVNRTCGPFVTCTEVRSCAGNTVRGTFGVKSFNPRSVVQFVPPSQMSFSLGPDEIPTISKVDGDLYFDYIPKSHNIRIDGMQLIPAPFETSVGDFSDIHMYVANKPQARCKGSPPPIGQPCTTYEIPVGDFVASMGFTLDGDRQALAATNTGQVITVQINHANATFRIQGTLKAPVKVDGENTTVTLVLDLTGQFINFAPVAVGTESTRQVECTEDLNAEPVVLRAAGSFDTYTPSPLVLPEYRWYEDYGLVTERILGTTENVTIQPLELGFGAHSFTLQVLDDVGVSDTDTFDVVVTDTIPPDLKPPPTAVTPIYPPGTGAVNVTLGQPPAVHDGCSGSVIVSNNAPADGKFPPGVSHVIWSADDERGNVVSATQEVRVRVLLEDLLIADLSKAGTTVDTTDLIIDVPPDAISMASILSYTNQVVGLPIPIGAEVIHSFDVDVATNTGTPITDFAEPIHFSIPYNEQELQQMGIPEESLDLRYWNGDTWESVVPSPGCPECGVMLDLEANVLISTLDHLSTFAVTGDAPPRGLYLPYMIR